MITLIFLFALMLPTFLLADCVAYHDYMDHDIDFEKVNELIESNDNQIVDPLPQFEKTWSDYSISSSEARLDPLIQLKMAFFAIGQDAPHRALFNAELVQFRLIEIDFCESSLMAFLAHVVRKHAVGQIYDQYPEAAGSGSFNPYDVIIVNTAYLFADETLNSLDLERISCAVANLRPVDFEIDFFENLEGC